jgi:hypothetical protein
VSRRLDLRWKKALYSPRQGLAVAILLGRSLRGPEPGVSGVSRQGRSLRSLTKVSGVSTPESPGRRPRVSGAETPAAYNLQISTYKRDYTEATG